MTQFSPSQQTASTFSHLRHAMERNLSRIKRSRSVNSQLNLVQERWSQLVGLQLGRDSKAVEISKGKLIVLVKNPIVKHAMQQALPMVLKRQGELGFKTYWERIELRLGRF